jgi:hypothetical protein
MDEDFAFNMETDIADESNGNTTNQEQEFSVTLEVLMADLTSSEASIGNKSRNHASEYCKVY